MALSLDRLLEARAISDRAKKPDTAMSRINIQNAFMVLLWWAEKPLGREGFQFSKALRVLPCATGLNIELRWVNDKPRLQLQVD